MNTSLYISILIVCFENPLWHFTKSLTSGWPVVRKGCKPPFCSSYVFMDIQLHWYGTVVFLHHQWLMWWGTQADHCICVRCYRVQFLLFWNWKIWEQWPKSSGHLAHHWAHVNFWHRAMHMLRHRVLSSVLDSVPKWSSICVSKLWPVCTALLGFFFFLFFAPPLSLSLEFAWACHIL